MKKQKIILENTLNEIEILEDTQLEGIYIANPNTKHIGKIKFIHKLPNIRSTIHIKSVVKDNSYFDLSALLIVEKGAKNTDTYLEIDCLVIGDNSFAKVEPSLEIKENEVKAGHGATVGYIDDATLNYLSQKGLDKKNIEKLIIESFLKFKE